MLLLRGKVRAEAGKSLAHVAHVVETALERDVLEPEIRFREKLLGEARTQGGTRIMSPDEIAGREIGSDLGSQVEQEIDKDLRLPRVAHGRYVLTEGAHLANADNLEFVLPDWVERATVEDGEIVIYTKPEPFSLRVR